MGKLTRLLKHRLWDEADARRALPAAALDRLQAQVTASEARHSGEIRVCVEAGLPLSYLWRNAPARQRAISMFGKLRVWDTEHNNGVLIYLLLAEHRIEVVADRGLNARAAPVTWTAMVESLSSALRSGSFEAGLSAAIQTADELLVAHFPLAEGVKRLNELPDAVVLL
jgi:uncharacterized membrane protein